MMVARPLGPGDHNSLQSSTHDLGRHATCPHRSHFVMLSQSQQPDKAINYLSDLTVKNSMSRSANS